MDKKYTRSFVRLREIWQIPCATRQRKANFFLLVICTPILIAESLVKQWEENGPKPQFPSSSVVIGEAKKKKKSLLKNSKLCRIAYYSCHEGPVFGSSVPVTKSWLQGSLPSKQEPPGKQTRVGVRRGLLRQHPGARGVARRARKDTNKYNFLNEDRNSSWGVKSSTIPRKIGGVV